MTLSRSHLSRNHLGLRLGRLPIQGMAMVVLVHIYPEFRGGTGAEKLLELRGLGHGTRHT